MKIGDEVFVHGYVDEIRNDVVIIRNRGGYFGTITEEMVLAEDVRKTCEWCKHWHGGDCDAEFCAWDYNRFGDPGPDEHCSHWEEV